MTTFKNTQKDAGLLLTTFIGICIRLSKDEIFFWSRSGNAFKELLVQPVSELNKLVPKTISGTAKQQRLDKSPYHSQVDLYGHFIDACRTMNREQARFWLKQKSRHLMISLLKKGEIEFLPAIEGKMSIPALLEQQTMESFRSKNFSQDRNRLLSVSEELHSKYKGTEESEVSCFGIACSLTGDEMISYSGGAEAIADVSFTPEQIRYLASQQKCLKHKGLLGYEGSNYFPIIGKDKILRLVSLQWLKPTFPGDNQIGRWHYWVLSTTHDTKPFSRFFVRA